MTFGVYGSTRKYDRDIFCVITGFKPLYYLKSFYFRYLDIKENRIWKLCLCLLNTFDS